LISGRDKKFFSLPQCYHSVQTGSGVHPASSTMGTGGLYSAMPAPASGTSAVIVLVLDSTLSSLRLKHVCLMTQTGESKGMLTVSNSGSSAPDHYGGLSWGC
jgi:hypothetical protein